MNTNSEAVLSLEDWANADPGYRRFQIRYSGPVCSTPASWRGGYAVLVFSHRSKRSMRRPVWCVGATLLMATQRAILRYNQSLQRSHRKTVR
jgi:hypothetical protein